MNWHQQAYEMYFNRHMKISDIASEIGISRQSVGAYLKTFSMQFNMEKEQRKKQNAVNRKAAKRYWDKHRRKNRYSEINEATMRREHELAAIELSRERYH